MTFRWKITDAPRFLIGSLVGIYYWRTENTWLLKNRKHRGYSGRLWYRYKVLLVLSLHFILHSPPNCYYLMVKHKRWILLLKTAIKDFTGYILPDSKIGKRKTLYWKVGKLLYKKFHSQRDVNYNRFWNQHWLKREDTLILWKTKHLFCKIIYLKHLLYSVYKLLSSVVA